MKDLFASFPGSLMWEPGNETKDLYEPVASRSSTHMHCSSCSTVICYPVASEEVGLVSCPTRTRLPAWHQRRLDMVELY